jgi:hypothetical protein
MSCGDGYLLRAIDTRHKIAKISGIGEARFQMALTAVIDQKLDSI